MFSGWGFAPDRTGELTALPKPLSGKGEGNEGEGRERKRREAMGGCLLLNSSLDICPIGLRIMFVNVRDAGLC